MIKPLYICLHIIIPFCSRIRTGHNGYQNSTQMVVAKKLLLLCRQSVCWHRLVTAIQHQSGNLLNRQFRSQVGSTLLGIQAPVLIFIKRVIAIQILEGKAVNRKDFHPRLWRIAQRRTTLLSYQNKRINLPFCPFRPFTCCKRQERSSHRSHCHPILCNHLLISLI